MTLMFLSFMKERKFMNDPPGMRQDTVLKLKLIPDAGQQQASATDSASGTQKLLPGVEPQAWCK